MLRCGCLPEQGRLGIPLPDELTHFTAHGPRLLRQHLQAAYARPSPADASRGHARDDCQHQPPSPVKQVPAEHRTAARLPLISQESTALRPIQLSFAEEMTQGVAHGSV